MIVLMLGSAPNVLDCRDWPRGQIDRIVAINNAWAVRPDWDFLVYPDDFPPERRPVDLAPGQALISSDQYVPENNRFGGIVYAGATMAFSAGYWALGALRPRVIAFLGCDMVYSARAAHFYGTGTADPLRPDPTLQDLRAKSARLELLAAQAGCAMVNLSRAQSALTFPRARPDNMSLARPRTAVEPYIAPVLAAERALGAVVPSGRYWEGTPLEASDLARIDALWLDAHAAVMATRPEAPPLRGSGNGGPSDRNGQGRRPHRA
jgi:hypothetical protein